MEICIGEYLNLAYLNSVYVLYAIHSKNIGGAGDSNRRLNQQRSVFPSDTALLNALYLAIFEAAKSWTAAIRNWGQVYGELSIMYERRLTK